MTKTLVATLVDFSFEIFFGPPHGRRKKLSSNIESFCTEMCLGDFKQLGLFHPMAQFRNNGVKIP